MMKRIVGTVVISPVLAVVFMLPIKTFSADSSNTSLLNANKVVTQVVTLLENAEFPSAPDYSDFIFHYEKQFLEKTPYREHSIKRPDEYELYAREFGKKVTDNKPTILLMHGFPDSLHAYDLIVPHLIEKNHVITFDFLGWGRSEKPIHHIYDSVSMLEDLKTIVAYFELNNIKLVAHDLSGFPGIDWSLKNPDHIDMLILLNTVYMPSKSLVSPDYIQRFASPGLARDISVSIARHSRDFWFDLYTRQLSQFFSNKTVEEAYLKIFSHQSFDAREAFFSAANVLRSEVGSRENKKEAMRQFTGRVKIIFGKDNKTLNVNMAKEFHEIFKNSQLHIIKNANHFVQLDQPQKVAELINGD